MNNLKFRIWDAYLKKMTIRNAAALKLLTERFDEGYWYDEPEPPDSEEILTEEQIAALPTESLRKQQLIKLRLYKQDLERYERELGDFQLIQKAVQTKDAALSYKLLMRRTNYEYENITIEELEEI